MDCKSPWQYHDCKSVEIVLLNLNFNCKESSSKWINFGSQTRGLNSEKIFLCSDILGDF